MNPFLLQSHSTAGTPACCTEPHTLIVTYRWCTAWHCDMTAVYQGEGERMVIGLLINTNDSITLASCICYGFQSVLCRTVTGPSYTWWSTGLLNMSYIVHVNCSLMLYSTRGGQKAEGGISLLRDNPLPGCCARAVYILRLSAFWASKQ